MNPALEQIPESVLEIGENSIAKQSISDEYNDNSTSPQLFDASSYFGNYPFDGIVFQSLKGYEPYFSGFGYDTTSTAMSNPTTYLTSAMSLPAGTGQEFPFRTGTDPPVPPPMVSMSNSSITNQFNESFPSPNQVSADIGFGPSKEADLARIQSVRNSQLEKRRAQNRNSQRAFRERKESYTNCLERELLYLRGKYDTALKCLYRLRAAYAAIESLDRFDVAFIERGMGITVEELKKEVEGETYGKG